MDCIFCKIIAGQIPSEILYRDDQVVAFKDIHPHAPTHLLIVPIEHIPSLADMGDSQTPIIAHMVKVANQLAREKGIARSGYRVTVNSGDWGGQVVKHLHMHLLGGRQLSGELG